ncbi:16S rRNA (uracil(1498)-N(3))-methyltransferase [Corynebacterium ulceribovis]|uniref:16S rRNA (uracil(1498)-N(3))-methyltransferase n=1 Tax=Corynebacterium ulceribovis TaxID=487732 RepID=UPI00036E7657|nr:16S rRNA (uracil(1498)-N(3))-methyltransferase [Corynebacterium ulceribovis]
MSLPVFIADALPETLGPQGVSTVLIDGAEGRHAATVKRLKVGEAVQLTDGRDRRATGTISEVRGKTAIAVAVTELADVLRPGPEITVVQAIPKGERGELSVDLMTQAGVDRIVIWQAARCIARWSGPKQEKGRDKWAATAREAAKQARRSWIPEVSGPATTADVKKLIAEVDTALVLHETAATPLTQVPLPESGHIVLIVGPEGGVTEEEIAAFTEAGARSVVLGPQVLRSAAAGAVALGALGALTPRWD